MTKDLKYVYRSMNLTVNPCYIGYYEHLQDRIKSNHVTFGSWILLREIKNHVSRQVVASHGH